MMTQTRLPETRPLLDNLCDPRHLERLSRICRRYGIAFMALFGSHVKGRVHPQSDVDIAVMPEPRRRPNVLRLYVDLVPIFGSDRLDIVCLRHAPPLLAWNVAREGRLLYAADETDWIRFRIRAMKEYDDARRFQKFWLKSVDRFLEKRGLR